MKYYFDMDGTLCEFRTDAKPEDLYRDGYFRSLKEPPGVVALLKLLVRSGRDVYVLSAVLGTKQETEKRAWLTDHGIVLPESHLIFVPCGTNKANAVPFVGKETVLIDDHTPNLLDWKAAGGTGIKVLTGINGKHGRWKGKAFQSETRFTADGFCRFALEDAFGDSMRVFHSVVPVS